jgi:hypothetical protein
LFSFARVFRSKKSSPPLAGVSARRLPKWKKEGLLPYPEKLPSDAAATGCGLGRPVSRAWQWQKSNADPVELAPLWHRFISSMRNRYWLISRNAGLSRFSLPTKMGSD